MGCAASSRIQPHAAEVAKDRKATAEPERQLAKARAALEAPAAFPSLGPAATAMGCASSQPVAPEPKTHTLRGVHAGVQLGWLKQFVEQVPPDISTLDVVLKIIKPATKERLCRYVLLAEEESPGAVGTAKIFASHTWRAPFRDLVAALAHVADDKDYVWIDIFAVLQWELEDGITKKQAAEKLEDLDFAAVVKATEAFVLVGTHVEAVAQLSMRDAFANIVPPEAKELSAFFRVWCLVEMAAALQAAKPVVLLVGKAARGKALRFKPNRAMLRNLFFVMDIRQAAASREEDRVRILKEVDEGVGADALNTLARGAAMGAMACMEEREVLSSVMGNDAPLAALQEPEALRWALLSAAAAGLMAPLKALLGRSDMVAVEAKDDEGTTALMRAATGGHATAIAALLAAGAEVEAKDNNGRRALVRAAAGGHAAAIAALVAAGAEVDAKTNNGSTALMAAAPGGHATAIAALLEAGAEVEAKDDSGYTALSFAAQGGHAAAIAALLAAGAEVKIKENDGRTTLMLAAHGGHAAAITALMAAGAEVEAKANDGETALMRAAAGGHAPAIEALVAAGAEVEAKDNDGTTSLMAAAQGGHAAAIEALLAAGAEVEAKTNDGRTALILAARGGHAAAITTLLEAGTEVEAKNINDMTALMFAAHGGHSAAIAALLAAGAEVDAKDNGGRTVLMAAALGGHAAAIVALLAAGAGVETKDEQGLTALEIAELCEHEHAARLLRGDAM